MNVLASSRRRRRDKKKKRQNKKGEVGRRAGGETGMPSLISVSLSHLAVVKSHHVRRAYCLGKLPGRDLISSGADLILAEGRQRSEHKGETS